MDEAELNLLMEDMGNKAATIVNLRPEIGELINELAEIQPSTIKTLVHFIKSMKQSLHSK
ncbi:hypothetical protein SEF58_01275 [Neomoorella humiferrea]|uniref:hypothetical protein n=1 Tax=Neomoorella humiferrea TaxID=676965 RepID=UPI003D8CA510